MSGVARSSYYNRPELGLPWRMSSISQQECETGSSEWRGTQFGSGTSPESSVFAVTPNHMHQEYLHSLIRATIR